MASGGIKTEIVHLSLTQSLSFIFCGFCFYPQKPANKKAFFLLLLQLKFFF